MRPRSQRQGFVADGPAGIEPPASSVPALAALVVSTLASRAATPGPWGRPATIACQRCPAVEPPLRRATDGPHRRGLRATWSRQAHPRNQYSGIGHGRLYGSQADDAGSIPVTRSRQRLGRLDVDALATRRVAFARRRLCSPRPTYTSSFPVSTSRTRLTASSPVLRSPPSRAGRRGRA
jgi:hypothetical protein